MEYEPLKRRLNVILKMFPFTRKIFYFLLDAVILRQWYVKRAIRNYLSKNKLNFYDAGSGFGQYSCYVLKHYPAAEILAVDIDEEISEAFRRFINKRYPKQVKIEKADLQNYIPENKQDMIIAIDILEHIEDDLTVLKNFRKVIDEEGYLIISTPYAGKEAEYTAEHVRNGYTIEELEGKLNEAGWEIQEFWFSYGFWGNIAWHLGMKIPLSEFKCLLRILLPFYLLLVYPFVLVMMVLDYNSKNRKGKGMVVVARGIKDEEAKQASSTDTHRLENDTHR
ncbi:MAG: class I SAM-dependent methyltransferase [Candidatus Cloacimonetes bacterium]|nr:class I SAM-dependent methyltransferase [Candidatus Cloacimonadota bacterium]